MQAYAELKIGFWSIDDCILFVLYPGSTLSGDKSTLLFIFKSRDLSFLYVFPCHVSMKFSWKLSVGIISCLSVKVRSPQRNKVDFQQMFLYQLFIDIVQKMFL